MDERGSIHISKKNPIEILFHCLLGDSKFNLLFITTEVCVFKINMLKFENLNPFESFA